MSFVSNIHLIDSMFSKIASVFDENTTEMDIVILLERERGNNGIGVDEITERFYNPEIFGRISSFWIDRADMSFSKFYRIVKGLEYDRVNSFYFLMTKAFYMLEVDVSRIVEKNGKDGFSSIVFYRLITFIEEAEKINVGKRIENILDIGVSGYLVDIVYDYIQ